MEKLIIDRSKWRTGSGGKFSTGTGDTALRNGQGFMCCLGFEALRLKFDEHDIIDVGEPCDIPGNPEFHNNRFVSDAIGINDNTATTLEEKEKKLVPLFATEGIELQFINEPIINHEESTEDISPTI